MDWNALIDAARAENERGIPMRGTKKYTSAAKRVDLMRRHLGALGITTEIVRYATEKGEPVVVKATIADEAGRVLATGHAEEIRGQGNINQTSALENAETSAIGRALAALGISGGEFASANEMDGVERKTEALGRPKPVKPVTDLPAKAAKPVPLEKQMGPQPDPQEPAPDRDPAQVAGALVRLIGLAETVGDLSALMGRKKFADAHDWLAVDAPEWADEVTKAVNRRRDELDPHEPDSIPDFGPVDHPLEGVL